MNDQRAIHLARTLDHTISSLTKSDTPQAEQFRMWRRRATLANIQPTEFNISFRAYQMMSGEGKLLSVCAVDASVTDGSVGSPRRGAYLYCYFGAAEGQEIVSVPLVYLLREHGPITSYYVLYEHGAVDYSVTAVDVFKSMNVQDAHLVPMPAAAHGSNGLIYVGITSRAWTIRYTEHINRAKSGSHLLFHRALRTEFATCNTRFHYVLMLFREKDQAYDAEEQFIEQRSLFPNGLNSIPGGKKGLKFLASLKVVGQSVSPEPGERDAMLEKYVADNPEVQANFPATRRVERSGAEGQDRPEMAEFWSVDENAARMITSRADRLSIEQIRNARYDASLGLSPQEIADHIGARNVEIVMRLLQGKTYARVP